MLAMPGTSTQVSGAEWAYEMKWDGVRIIADVRDGGVGLWSRDGHDVTATYPEVVAALPSALDVTDALLDGEIVALDAHGRPSFGMLQYRMGVAAPIADLIDRVPVFFMVFDVLRVAGKSVRDQPYAERRAHVMGMVLEDGVVHAPPELTDLSGALRTSLELGLEGIVAKRLDSRYLPGRRARTWIKLKHFRTQEVLVGGWREGRGARASGFGSLLLGIPDDDGRLTYIGRVGSGFTERDLRDGRRRLDALARADAPFLDVPREVTKDAHWVEPVLVAEVQYVEWTASGQLRQPTWRGWRDDKSPTEVRRED